MWRAGWKNERQTKGFIVVSRSWSFFFCCWIFCLEANRIVFTPAYKYVYFLLGRGGIPHSCKVWARPKLQWQKNSVQSRWWNKRWRGLGFGLVSVTQRQVDIYRDSERTQTNRLRGKDLQSRGAHNGKQSKYFKLITAASIPWCSVVITAVNVMFAFSLCIHAKR